MYNNVEVCSDAQEGFWGAKSLLAGPDSEMFTEFKIVCQANNMLVVWSDPL